MAGEQANNPQPQINRVSLQAIEAEGTKATNDLARIIVHETVNNKGKVDFARLDRVGPTVSREVLKLFAKTAASLAPPPRQDARQTGRAEAQKSTAAPLKQRPASTTPVGTPSARRAKKGWRDRCCDARSFRTDAYRYGLAVSTPIGLAFMALLFLMYR